jgi:hypothetical protein
MLGPDPIDEGTMSGNMGASMKIGSAFIQRPRNQFGISQWEKVGEEQGADKTIPRVGVDNQEKPAYTMDDLLRQAAQLEATDDGGEIPTKLQKKLRKDSPAYAEPGEFDAASGGTAPGKKRKVKVEGDLDEGSRSLKRLARKEKAANKGKNPGYFEKVSSHEKKSADSRRRYAAGPGKGIEAGVAFDKNGGFFLTEKTKAGKLTDKEQSKINKAAWKKMSPKEKSKYTGDNPMPSHYK